MSLLTAQQKSSIQSVFDKIHNTFKIPISIYKKEKVVFIATNDTYNALYDRERNSPQQREQVKKYDKFARVLYDQKQEKIFLNSQTNVGIPDPLGEVRLKVDEETYNLINGSERIELDGRSWNLHGDPARTGPFDSQYYVLYLKREA